MTTTVAPDPPTNSARRTNPYVGPRAFRYGERLYGRNREISELRDLIVAQRIVLLYSPSGAGKSSLLEAGLRAELGGRDLAVFPTIRVSHDVPPALEGLDVRNRYVLSMLLSLEEGCRPELQLGADELNVIRVSDYLQRWEDELPPGSDPCLMFDQFEELFTLDPTDEEKKGKFIEELGVALRARGRWAIFAMREDYIAQLDPHLAAIPTRFSARYRLDLLHPRAAKLAVRVPANAEGVDFTDAAADRLMDDLRKVKVQRGTTVTDEFGPSVEPVQLQVVCRQLWETLPADATTVGLEDILSLGDVDDALADFYADSVRSVAASTGVNEREIRAWFDESLITTQGFRAQALEGPGERGPSVVRALEDAHLIRADQRRGARWYELAHDRLVAPVHTNNVAWREQHLSTLQREAQVWDQQSRPPGLLMTGRVLADAENWAATHPDELSTVDRDYLDACKVDNQRSHRERKAAKRNRRLAILAIVVGLVAIAGLIAAIMAWSAASGKERRASKAEATALAGQARLLSSSDPALALALAAEADRRHPTVSTSLAIGAAYDAFVNSGLLKTIEYPGVVMGAGDLSDNGDLIANATGDDQIAVWDWATSAEPRTIAPGHAHIQQMVFSPTGSYLAVVADDGTVELWDPVAGKQLRILGRLGQSTFQPWPLVAFSPDESTLAGVNSDSGSITLWNRVTGKELSSFATSLDYVAVIAFEQDGSTLVVATQDGKIARWNVTTGQMTLVPQRDPVESGTSFYGWSALAFNKNASMFAAADYQGQITVFDLDPVAPGEPKTLATGSRPVSAVTFSPAGHLASADDDGVITIWDTKTGRELRKLTGHHGSVLALAFARDGSTLTSVGADQTVRRWNPDATSERAAFPTVSDGAMALAYNQDGSALIGVEFDGVVWMDPTTGKPLRPKVFEDYPRAVGLSADRSKLAIARGGYVEVLDTSSGRELKRIGTPGSEPDCVLALTDDATLVVGSSIQSGAILVWDAASNRELRRITGEKESCPPVALNGTGSMLAIADADGTLTLSDPSSGRVLRKLPTDGDPVYSLAFSPNGALLAGARADGSIDLWDPSSGQELRTLSGSGLGQLQFSPDGLILATSSAGTVSLWDPQNGGEPRNLSVGSDLAAIAFSPDGATLATAAWNSPIKLWAANVSPSEACRLAELHISAEGLRQALGGDAPARLHEHRPTIQRPLTASRPAGRAGRTHPARALLPHHHRSVPSGTSQLMSALDSRIDGRCP